MPKHMPGPNGFAREAAPSPEGTDPTAPHPLSSARAACFGQSEHELWAMAAKPEGHLRGSPNGRRRSRGGLTRTPSPTRSACRRCRVKTPGKCPCSPSKCSGCTCSSSVGMRNTRRSICKEACQKRAPTTQPRKGSDRAQKRSIPVVNSHRWKAFPLQPRRSRRCLQIGNQRKRLALGARKP